MSIVDSRRKGSLLGPVLLAVIASWTSTNARASQPPLLPVGPYDWAPPTPASPPPDSYELPTDINYSVPPFNAPLPPAINYPPPIVVPHAVTPPVPCGPFGNECRDNPGPVAPYLLPETAANPDVAEPPAGGLRQALSEYDRRIGLGGGGAIVAAARKVLEGEYVTGSATFEVIADPSGRIRAVRLQDASRDREGWQRFGEELHQERVAGMRAREHSQAVWMILYVSAENELPTGNAIGWYPGTVISFDSSNIGSQRVRSVSSRVLTEVWY
jgi:hypothetical protein